MSTSGVFENVTSMRNAAIPHVVVNGTDVGYDVRTETLDDRAVLIERVSAIAGLALVAMALAAIYIGRVYQLQGLGSGHLATGAVLLTGGIAYLWISARGMRHQTNFDLKKRTLDYVVRNHLDSTRVLRSVSLDEIDDTFIEEAHEPGKPAKLFVRIGDDDLIEVARGSEEELDELRDRIARDLPKAA